METSTVLRNQAWREDLRKSIRPKERSAMSRVVMPQADPLERTHNNMEVNRGLSPEMAREEARRCLDCQNPTCVEGCPVGIRIPDFIKYIEAGDFLRAAAIIKEDNVFPSICGRVCPQEAQCEARCVYPLKMNREPVAIGNLERFAADFEISTGQVQIPHAACSNGIKIGVVGSGPAGLAAAGDLARLGYCVTVFEALHDFGGVLRYGIPEFRLPKAIVNLEINNLRLLGVTFEKNFIVGRTQSFGDLSALGYRAFFVGSGAGLPQFMHIPGENYNGILSANEYLTRVNLMGASIPGSDTPVYRGQHVAVIGGGNTAMDAVRTARRLGASRAMIIYRRSLEEMPARREEIEHAREEGVEFINLCSPVAYNAGGNGHVKEMVVQRMELGEPDESGRRKPIPVAGSEFIIPVDQVIVSVGVSPNPLIANSLPQLNVSRRGTLLVEENSMQCSIPGLFAGGDIVRGGATVILAMGDGRRAAESIHSFLSEQGGL